MRQSKSPHVPKAKRHRPGIWLILLLSCILLPFGVAAAETFRVTKSDDTNDGVCDGDCSLREAVIAANSHPGPDTVLLPSGILTLSIPAKQEEDSATGDLDITDDLTLAGHDSHTRISAASSLGDRVLQVHSGDFPVEATIRNVILQGGAGMSGGGILNGSGTVTLESCSVSGNTANLGGGVANGSGTLVLDECNVSGNHAEEGGGITNGTGTVMMSRSTISGNTAVLGGGLLNYGKVLMAGTTISGNAAENGGGIFNIDHGEAILLWTTLSGNTAEKGGGIFNVKGAVSLTNCTVARNDAQVGGGMLNFGVLEPANTIIATNKGGNCTNRLSFNSGGHNLSDDGTCPLDGPGDLMNTAPLLAPLAHNGGPVQTHALLRGSPAIDAGDNGNIPDPDPNRLDPDFSGIADGDADGTATVDMGAHEFSPPRE